MCEILPPYSIISRKTRQEELGKIIKALNYNICKIKKNNKYFDGLIHIQHFEIHSDPCLKDYLFIPNEVFEFVSKQLNLQITE